MRRTAFTLAVLSFASVAFAERPTADEVAKAVEQSREIWKARLTLRSADEMRQVAIRDAEIRVVEHQYALRRAIKARNAKKIRDAKRTLRDAEKHLRRVPREDFEAEKHPDILPLNPFGQKIAVGQVGRYAIGTHSRIKIVHKLDDDRFLGRYGRAGTDFGGGRRVSLKGLSRSIQRGVSRRPNIIYRNERIYVGLDVSKLADGEEITDVNEINFVVTGTYTYTLITGESRTVYVMESFDPDKPFE